MLTVSHLSLSRGHRRLFSDVSFSLMPGQWLHLEGDNGVGKTSLLRLLCGLGVCEQGEVTWKNQSIVQEPENFRADLLYLGHQLALKEDLSPLENLRADALVAGRDGSVDRVMAALGQMGLRGREHLPVRVLSQGQKRRTALARLLISRAPLWILDEPFVALDAAAQNALSGVINAHLNHAGMLLVTSHQPLSLQGQALSYRLTA
jgi:heme exporter protein A